MAEDGIIVRLQQVNHAAVPLRPYFDNVALANAGFFAHFGGNHRSSAAVDRRMRDERLP